MSNSKRIQKIIELQQYPENIRNISIVAHVDHGKTTLTDCLLSSNNIISKKLVGKLRYMDSRPDEQMREITMKSSAIGVSFMKENKEYLINIIDSPGHVEFSSEVSYALRLTDGALVLVDVVEGISSQTYTVLRQAFDENIKIILVLNKMDKLISELHLSPLEAYRHLYMLIEQINAILGSLLITNENSQQKCVQIIQFMMMCLQYLMYFPKQYIEGWRSYVLKHHPRLDDLYIIDIDLFIIYLLPHYKNNFDESYFFQLLDQELEQIEENLYFSPSKGNMVFCSAIDGWGFTIQSFAEKISKKLNCNPDVLQKYLWGDYFMDPKTKKISKSPLNDKHKPMFVDFILNNIWSIYERVQSQDFEKVKKVADSLQQEFPDKMATLLMKDPSQILNIILNTWLPIDQAILNQVVSKLPGPQEAQKYRLPLICKKLFKEKKNLSTEQVEQLQKIKNAVSTCDCSEEAPVVVFISKMIQINRKNINEAGLNQYKTNDNEIKFIGFARIFSGTLTRQSKVFVIQAKKNLEQEYVPIDNIYMLMGQYPEGIQSVKAGNIFAIGNLDNIVFKTATLSNYQHCPSFTQMNLGAVSLLKVSVTTQNIEDYPKLIEGLKKLNKSDPSVDVYAQENGDIILSTCGEVHLERCINDLEEVFSQVKIKHSEPIISFKETVTYTNLNEVLNKKTEEQIRKQILLEQQKLLKEQQNEDDVINNDEYNEEIKKLEGTEIIDITMESRNETWDNEHDAHKRIIKEYIIKMCKYQRYLKLINLKDTEKQKKYDKMIVQKVTDQKKNFAKNTSKLNKINIINLKDKSNQVVVMTSNHKLQLTVRVIGMDFEFAEFLEKQSQSLKKLFQVSDKLHLQSEIDNFLSKFEQKMEDCNFSQDMKKMVHDKLFSLGPENYGPNFLFLNWIKEGQGLLQQLKNRSIDYEGAKIDFNDQETMQQICEQYKINVNEINKAICTGFDLATRSGPLCEEPMVGCIFLVESIDIVNIKLDNNEQNKNKSSNQTEEFPKQEEEQQIEKEISQTIQKDPYGPISGQIISAMKEACLESFQGACPRLVEGMYLCHIQTDQQYYGKAYEVLNKRRAVIIDEELNENSNLYIIKAHLPLIESFGFYKEIMKNTSGRISSQLIFDTWKIQELDPFYTPQTEDEIEQHGEQILIPNLAKQLLDKIRKRKGIYTEQKIVVAAEKQRTLARKK